MIDKALLMAQAALLRKEFGEDSSSPVDIFALAQTINGLTIVYFPLGDKLSGMCIKGQEDNNVIAVNSAMTLGRQRFSMAHEFYHLYFDNNMRSICAKKLNFGKDIEKSADMFASYFLMPEPALIIMAKKLAGKNADNSLSLSDLVRIEQYFGVSHQATIYRLLHTPFLSQDKGNIFLTAPVRNIANALGYSSDLYKPLPEERQYMTYGHYIGQADKAYAAGLVSNGKYEELLLDAFRQDIVYGEDDEAGDIID